MDNTLLQLLQSVGLKPKEAGVYLALLELGKGTVAKIAKLSGLKRSIIYVVLADLIKTGYISQLPGKKINEYQAIDPAVIATEQKTSLKNFTEMLPLLQSLRNKSKSRPVIHYIETKQGIWNVYEEMNYAKECFFISDYASLEKLFPGGVNKWIENCRKGIYKVKARHLIPDSPENIKYGKKMTKVGQKVKILAVTKKYDMDFTLYENKLAITSLGDEPFMVLIESEGLVNSMKPIFEIAWKAGKPV